MKSPRVKICCIADLAEARLAVDYGAAALGLVGAMPSGPGPITDAAIRAVAAAVPPPIATFLLTSETTVEAITAHHARVATNTIQIVDALREGAYADLRRNLPGVKLVQVIHIQDEAAVDEALRIAPQVDALLLDSGNPARRELGGTGRVHDWRLSRRIVEQTATPVFLAGGLNPDNVARAIETVQPFGLDLCSGVRTGGRLEEAKVARFFRAVYG